jgi:hypothetical protein
LVTVARVNLRRSLPKEFPSVWIDGNYAMRNRLSRWAVPTFIAGRSDGEKMRVAE